MKYRISATAQTVVAWCLIVYGSGIFGAAILSLILAMMGTQSSLGKLILAMDESGVFYVYAAVLFVAAFVSSFRETTKLITSIAAGMFLGMAMLTTNYLSWPLDWVINIIYTSPYSGFIVASGIAALLVSAGLSVISSRQR